jgi:F-type H+-transporting ATPase subunit alpha
MFLETDLFYSGVRPAINAGISVSRVGGNAQIKAMKQVAGRLRLDLAQYRELEAFAKFGSDLDKATQQQLHRGQRLMEILKQDQYSPMPFENQIVVIFAATNGYVDGIRVDEIKRFESEFLSYLNMKHATLLTSIAEKKVLDDEVKEKLIKALEDFLKIFKTEAE